MSKFRVINMNQHDPMNTGHIKAVDYKQAAGIAKSMLAKSARNVGDRVLFDQIEIYPENVWEQLISNDMSGKLFWWDDAKIDDAAMYNGQLSYISTVMRNTITELRSKNG